MTIFNNSLIDDTVLTEELEKLSGPLPYCMTNDYLFRIVLQENNKVLTGLICALMHLSPDEVMSVTLDNPVLPGKRADKKLFLLDIRVILNNSRIISIELQVINTHNWPERSLSYLCRAFDNVTRGEDYISVSPVTHISILDFELFPEYPEFFATYKLLNVVNHNLYSDKFVLSVLQLNHMELATAEDKKYKIDYWAKLFKATTWEEVKAMAKEDEYVHEAFETIYKVTSDDMVRRLCDAREDYYRLERTNKKIKQQLEEDIEKMKEKLQNMNDEYDSLNNEYDSLNNEIGNLNNEIGNLNNEIGNLNNENENLNKENRALNEEIARLQALLSEKNT